MIILDCEASGLGPTSYPIQIAWLNVKTGESDSFYIKPSENWTDWDPNAEDVHNIPRERLFDEGISVLEAAHRLYQKIGKAKTIYSDAPDYEHFWVMRLFEESRQFMYEMEFAHVVDMHESFEEAQRMNQILLDQSVANTRTHDALDDCHSIAEAYRRSLDA